MTLHAVAGIYKNKNMNTHAQAHTHTYMIIRVSRQSLLQQARLTYHHYARTVAIRPVRRQILPVPVVKKNKCQQQSLSLPQNMYKQCTPTFWGGVGGRGACTHYVSFEEQVYPFPAIRPQINSASAINYNFLKSPCSAQCNTGKLLETRTSLFFFAPLL